MSKKFVIIYCEVFFEVFVEDVKYDGFEFLKVILLFKEFGFNFLFVKFGELVEEEVDFEELMFEVVQEVYDDMLISEVVLIVEGYEENYYYNQLFGFGISNKNGYYFIDKDIVFLFFKFKVWLEDGCVKKMVFNGKCMIVLLKWVGYEIKGIEYDVMIVFYILNFVEVNDDLVIIVKLKGYY